MLRKGIVVALAGLALTSTAAAQQAAWKFRWQTGQVLTYRVEQITTAAEEAGPNKSSTTSKLNLLKRWQVLQVDAAGIATVQLALASLRLETTTPGGETIIFDSANPDKSSPELREQMQRYVNTPLAVLRVDGNGRVVEVKESKFGPASRYQSELPFVIALPNQAPQPGQFWERSYVITLDPPHGAGEKYDAVQKYTCAQLTGGAATITLTTDLKSKPPSAADEVPLLQFLPQGEVVFDVQAGILRSARLRIDKEVTGHQGEGSRYRFQSSYTEEYVPGR